MPPAARLNDLHVCPMVTPGLPPIPHVGGPILPPCAPTVIIGGQPAARMGDMAFCTASPPDVIAKGSPTVMISGMMAARMLDPTAHGGMITVGFPTVMIGEAGGGPGAPAVVAFQAAAADGATSVPKSADPMLEEV